MSTNGLKTKSHIENFITTLADKYGLAVSDLKHIWDTTMSPSGSPKGSPKGSPTKRAFDALAEKLETTSIGISEDLSRMSCKELMAHCKARNLKVSGTKQALIARLNGNEGKKIEASSTRESSTRESSTRESSTKRRKSEPSEPPKVIKSVQAYIHTIKITRNTFGNFQHEETGLVFDKVTKQVIGKQNPNGQINHLTVEDIELCNKFKFKYTLPDNLNAFKKANTSVIEELEEDGIEPDEVKTEEGENDDEDFLEDDEGDEEVEEEPIEDDDII